ncbi:MAG: LOW QUALITY PROTEIN: late exocytosis, associated with Golgi transport-domain-containing protein, partial [Olpidium bornovanus]
MLPPFFDFVGAIASARCSPLFRTIYSPRTFLVEGKARSDPLPNSYFGWIRPLLILDQETIVSRVGLDAYTFLRFLRIGFVLFASASVFAVPVLVPINAISADGLAVGYSMNRLTVGNVLDGDRRLMCVSFRALVSLQKLSEASLNLLFHLRQCSPFYERLLCRIGNWEVRSCSNDELVLFTILTLLPAGTITLIIRELRSFLQLRYQVLTSPEHLADVGSRTVLVHNVPRNSASPEKLKDIFSLFPGGVVTVSVYQDVGGLPGLVKQRDTCLTKLERLETHYIADANRILAGQRGKAQAAQLSKSVAETDGAARTLASQLDKPQAARHPKSAVETDHHTVEMQDFQRIDPVSFPRPQHITGGIRRFLPFCSTQSARVDAISYFRQKYQVLADRVQTQRELLFGAHLSAAHQSAFITFRYQYAAHLAAQSVISVDPETFTPRVVDVSPDDVVYANLNIDARIRRIRRLIGISASAALAVFWSIPTFIVSSIASLDKLADYVPFVSTTSPKQLAQDSGQNDRLNWRLFDEFLPFVKARAAENVERRCEGSNSGRAAAGSCRDSDELPPENPH